MRWISGRIGLRACALAIATVGFAATVVAQNDLVGVLKKKYVITQTSLNRSQIMGPGTVVDVQANGISAEPWDQFISLDNPVVDGSVQQHSKYLDLVARSKNRMVLKPGDKVYITKIEGVAGGKNDTLKFSVLSCDPLDVDGGASQKRFAATISFRLPKGGLQQTSPDEAERMVDAVLAQDAGDQGGGASAPNSAVAAAPQPPQPAPPLQRPPAPVATQTIAMGQTIDQVVGIMGQPQQIIDLGAKKRYKYKDMTVVFVNGKVSDVQ